jgi:hypothetical protein
MKQALGVFGFALLVRIAYIGVFVTPEQLGAEDQLLYISMARSILDSGLVALTTERVYGYPLFMSAVFFLFGHGLYGLLGVQAVVDSLSCVLVGRLADAALGRGFLIAGLLSALNLNMVILSGMVLTDSLFLCLFTLFLLFLIRFLHGHRTTDYIGCLFFLVAATAVRSASYYLVPCMMLALAFWSGFAAMTPRRIALQFMTGVAIFAAILGPQHLRNWQRYETLSLVSQGGTHLLGWVVPAVYQYSGRGSYQEGQDRARSRLEQAMAADGLTMLSENPFAASRYRAEVAGQILRDLGWMSLIKAWSVGAAINFIAPSSAFAPAVRAMEHPSFYGTPGVGVVQKLWNYVTDARGALYLSLLAIGTLTSLAFFVAFLIGWWGVFRQSLAAGAGTANFGVALFLGLIVAYFVGVTGPIIGSKYRLPMEPIMTIFVAGACCRNARRSSRANALDATKGFGQR